MKPYTADTKTARTKARDDIHHRTQDGGESNRTATAKAQRKAARQAASGVPGMTTKPSADDLYIAAQWLDVYEGSEDAQACQRVRAWLLRQSDAVEFRETCRAAGVSVAQARKAIKAAKRNA